MFRGYRIITSKLFRLIALSTLVTLGQVSMAAEVLSSKVKTKELPDGLFEACVDIYSKPTQQSLAAINRFITADPKPTKGIAIRGTNVCLDGIKVGATHLLSFKPGLSLESGLTTKDTTTRVIRIAPRDPELQFASVGWLYAKNTLEGIELRHSNVKEIDIRIYKVDERNLVSFVSDQNLASNRLTEYPFRKLIESQGQLVYSGAMDLDPSVSERASTIIPVGEVLQKHGTGAFVVLVADARDTQKKIDNPAMMSWRESIAAQFIVHTDIGLSVAKFEDGMVLGVRSLATAKPIAGASVQVIAKNNRILLTAKSDRDGIVRIPKATIGGKNADAPAMITASTGRKGQIDLAITALQRTALDMSQLALGGRTAPEILDVYLFSDRGIYRPREKVFVNGLVRDRMARAKGLDRVQLHVLRPNGTVYKQIAPKYADHYSIAESFELPAEAVRGQWKIRATSPLSTKPLAELGFEVQDFVPEKLKVTVQAPTDILVPGEQSPVQISADFLYGAPASGLAVEGGYVLRSAKSSELGISSLSGFRFGDDLLASPSANGEIELDRLDAQGKSVLMADFEVPGLEETEWGVATQPFVAELSFGVQEPGGRVSRAAVKAIQSIGKPVIALKPEFDQYVPIDTPVNYGVQVLDTKLKAGASALSWAVYRVRNQWTYNRSEGSWTVNRYQESEPIAKGKLKPEDLKNPKALSVNALSWGGYALVVYDETEKVYTRHRFSVGWSESLSSETPDFIELVAKSKSFKPGETVDVGVDMPYAGQGMLTVWTDRLVYSKSIRLSKGQNKISVPTNEDWFPGAHILLQAFRPLEKSGVGQSHVLTNQAYYPVRAYGSIYLEQDHRRSLQVVLPEQQKVRPRSPVKVPIQIKGSGDLSQARVVVFGVDEGILQLTKYQSPNPVGHYFAKRRLAVDFIDDYGRLIKADGTRGKLRTGGDSVAASGPSLEVVPTKSIVLYSGLVKVDASGRGQVEFNIPDFNGSLRMSAVAFTEDQFGASNSMVISRDPVVAELVFPRYLAPGDSSQATMLLANTEPTEQTVTVTVASANGILSVDQLSDTYTLAPGARMTKPISLKANAVGNGVIKLDLKSTSTSLTRVWDLQSVFPGKGVEKRTTLSLPASTNATTISLEGASEVKALGRRLSLSATPLKGVDLYRIAHELVRYPYGCSEQIISTASPLLLLLESAPELADTLGRQVFSLDRARQNTQTAVSRLLERQGSDGAIGLWGANDGLVDPHLAAQIAGFLVRARSAGFDLPDGAADAAVHSVIDRVDAWPSSRAVERDMVLARLAKEAAGPNTRLLRVARALADNVTTAYDFHTLSNVAVAMKRFGDQERLKKMKDLIESRMKLSKERAQDKQADPWMRRPVRYYESDVSLVAETAANFAELGGMESATRLFKTVSKARGNRDHYNTQEMAHLLPAFLKTMRNVQYEVDINGSRRIQAKRGVAAVEFTDAEIRQMLTKPISIQKTGKVDLDISLTLSGQPELTEEGIQPSTTEVDITKMIFDLKGEPATLSGRKVHDRLVVLLEADISNLRGRQWVVHDPIPAGYQIEKIYRSGESKRPWSGGDLSEPDVAMATDTAFIASELRGVDDRGDMLRYAYQLRATTPGVYLPAPARVEDMYNPANVATSDAELVRVLPAE
jgi:uncharacterized protein YfaS (alpha-2-macroglobulin family)